MATVLAMVVGTGGYAYTASNTVPQTRAGDGATAIGGYSVISLQYTLNSNTPNDVDSVAFTLTPTTNAPKVVKVQLTAAGPWYTCSIGGGNSISCDTTSPQATATGSDYLTVVAAQ